MKLFGSFQNRLMESNPGNLTPEVGMGATVLMYSDRYAATITEVNGKTLKCRRDKVTGSGPMGHQEWACEYNPNGREETYTLRKNGRWVLKGEPLDARSLLIGEKDEYRDWEF